LWAPPSGTSARLDDRGLARLTPVGIGTLTPQDGIDLFDEAQRRGEPHLIPIRLDRAVLATSPHPLLRALAPTVPATAPADQRLAAPSRGTADDLATMPPAQQHLTLLTLIRDTAALVLGHGDTTMLTATTSFKDLGVDSVTAVELRNRLAAATDLRLPATLVFDYPTPEHLVTYLRGRLGLDGTPSQDAVRTALRAVPAGSTEHRRMVALLGDVLHRAGDATVPGASDSVSDLDSASDQDLFALVDEVGQ
jgi:acyl carrier protein